LYCHPNDALRPPPFLPVNAASDPLVNNFLGLRFAIVSIVPIPFAARQAGNIVGRAAAMDIWS
jgi:hypothetical protein